MNEPSVREPNQKGSWSLRRAVRSLRASLGLFWPARSGGGPSAAAGVAPPTPGDLDADMTCVRCGRCCTFLLVKLTRDDIRVLGRGLGLSNREVLRRHIRMTAIGPVLRQNGDRCTFLTGGENGEIAACGVYALRPEACRRWMPSTSRFECQEGLREFPAIRRDAGG